MDCISDAARLARRLRAEINVGALWQSLKAFAAPHGFHHLTALKRVPELPERLVPSVVFSDAPAGFAEAFDRQNLCPDHPLILRALNEREPFSASELQATTPLTAAQRQVLNHVSRELDVLDGWTVPIACGSNLRGVLMFGGRNPNMSVLLRSVLHLLAHRAFIRSEELADRAFRAHGLTLRELECLRWVALGKTDAEIAVILAISPRTARFHVENAKMKLRADTRVQAVAEALRLNAIAA